MIILDFTKTIFCINYVKTIARLKTFSIYNKVKIISRNRVAFLNPGAPRCNNFATKFFKLPQLIKHKHIISTGFYYIFDKLYMRSKSNFNRKPGRMRLPAGPDFEL